MALALEDSGYEDVHVLLGGFDAWKDAGGPTVPKEGAATSWSPYSAP